MCSPALFLRPIADILQTDEDPPPAVSGPPRAVSEHEETSGLQPAQRSHSFNSEPLLLPSHNPTSGDGLDRAPPELKQPKQNSQRIGHAAFGDDNRYLGTTTTTTYRFSPSQAQRVQDQLVEDSTYFSDWGGCSDTTFDIIEVD